jgi:hypothetical protein
MTDPAPAPGGTCQFIQDDMFPTGPIYTIISVSDSYVTLKKPDGQHTHPTRATFDRWWKVYT